MQNSTKIRVLIVDDHPVTRSSLKLLLFLERDIEVIGTLALATEALVVAPQMRPDVVLMDIDMPGLDGVSAAEQLRSILPATRIILMSVESQHPRLQRAFLVGVSAFLTKPISGHDLAAAIRGK